jgi:hypothetical protein
MGIRSIQIIEDDFGRKVVIEKLTTGDFAIEATGGCARALIPKAILHQVGHALIDPKRRALELAVIEAAREVEDDDLGVWFPKLAAALDALDDKPARPEERS